MPVVSLSILADSLPGWFYPAAAGVFLFAAAAVALICLLLIRLRRHHRGGAETQTRIRLVLDQMPAIIWTVDNEFRFTSIDGAGMDNLGSTGADMVGKTIYEYFQTSDRAFRPIAGHEDAIRDRKPSSYEVTWHERIYQVHLEPWKDQAGHFAGVIGVSLDITERKKAEHLLSANEARSRALLTAIPDVMFRLRADGTVLEFMDKLAAPPLTRSGVHIRLLYPEIAERATEMSRAAISTGQIQMFEHASAQNGRSSHVEVRFAVCGKDEVLVIVRNITERKKAENDLRRREAELRSLVRAIPDLLFLTTRDGRISGCSAANEADLLAPPDEMIGRHFSDFLPPSIAELIHQHLQLAREFGQPQIFQYSLDFAGQPRRFEARMVFTGDGSDQVLTLVRNITDIADKRT